LATIIFAYEAAKKNDTLVTIIPALVERDAVAENNVTNFIGSSTLYNGSGFKSERGALDRQSSIV